MAHKISVFCIWRDGEKNIDRTLAQLEQLELMGHDFSYYFYENDSKDNTVKILKEWLSSRKGELLSENLRAKKYGSTPDPERMAFLCECRNKAKDLAGENDSDYSLLIDSDILFGPQNLDKHLDLFETHQGLVMSTSNIRQNLPDMVFSKTKDSYYDVYAFKDRHGGDGIYFSDCPSFIKEDQELWEKELPISVSSAFGGLALVSSEAFNLVRWSSDVCCDHVNMCYDLRNFGEILVDPTNIVRTEVDVSTLNMLSINSVGIEQIQRFNKYYKK